MTQPALPDPTDASITDLLSHLVSAEPAYPWDVTDPGIELYWQRLDESLESLAPDSPMEATIKAGWSHLASQLDRRWQALPIAQPLDLGMPWGDQLPGDLLETLVATARGLVHQGQSRLDQLVSCVSAILPDWDPQDLAILARPLAYSLRDGQNLDLKTSFEIPNQPWAQRSPVEQARLDRKSTRLNSSHRT